MDVAPFTLWRGGSLISRLELSCSIRHGPSHLHGNIEHTAELEALGPMVQQRVSHQGRIVVVQSSVERAVNRKVETSRGPVPIHEGEGTGKVVSADDMLYVRDETSEDLRADFIVIFEPAPLPADFLEGLPPDMLRQVQQWTLTCRLSTPVSE